MASNVHELRPKPYESEKITINLGYVDLGHVDLMVREGFHSNRTDFIRTAIRNQLERNADVVKQPVERIKQRVNHRSPNPRAIMPRNISLVPPRSEKLGAIWVTSLSVVINSSDTGSSG